MLQVVKIPDPILTKPSKPVGNIDRKILDFVGEMKKTLVTTKNPKGVGLAAPQVGKGFRIFITKPTEKSPCIVFINPEIVWLSEERTDGVPRKDNKFEGCLSIPNVWGIVRRHQAVWVQYQSPDGKRHTRLFKGFPATIIQHEMDHIDGILFTKRVLEQKNKFYKVSGKDKEGKDVFEEIEV